MRLSLWDIMLLEEALRAHKPANLSKIDESQYETLRESLSQAHSGRLESPYKAGRRTR